MSEAPIAVSIGDPAGIGPEVLAKTWVRRREDRLRPFFAIGDIRSISTVWKGPLQRIGDPAAAIECFDEALPIMEVEDAGEIIPGKPNMPGARCAIASLEIAARVRRARSSPGRFRRRNSTRSASRIRGRPNSSPNAAASHPATSR
jgi:4-hydroxythreonine-4-phosphate dehydrogenase